MKVSWKLLFGSVLASLCVVTAPAMAEIQESISRQAIEKAPINQAAKLVVQSKNEGLQLAWCRAMGGYPSFEAQARAQAAERARRKSETRRAQSAQVMTDQQSLQQLGYYRGTADGRVGPATTSAIRQFRSANNLGPGTTLDSDCRQLITSGKAVRKGESRTDGEASTLRSDQEVLANLGFYKGKVDGIDGRLTRAAIREFKLKNGLDASTDTLDASDRAKLKELSAAKSTSRP